MTERERKALQSFAAGHNCAQSVLLAYGDLAGLDEKQAGLISAGFGGGMGRLRQNCGAYSAAVMLCGIMAGADGDAPTRRPDVYRRVQDVHRRFVDRLGSINCAELLGRPQGAEVPVPEDRGQPYYASRPCARIILAACRIIEDEFSTGSDVS